jgi:antitoxin component HigA of HigAB toxin-antitoxin module
LEDITLYKAKQETLEESVKDLLKSVDEISARFENIPTKKDLDSVRSDILLVQKQIEEINKVLPIVKTRLPETVEKLKREKDDILLFLNSLEDQLKSGAISVGEYEEVKKKNLQRLADVEKRLEREWKLVEEIISKGAPEVKVEEAPAETKQEVKEQQEAGKEEKPEETTESQVMETQEEKKQVEVEAKKVEHVAEEHEETKQLTPEKPETEEKAKREEMVDILKKIKERFK